MSDTTTTTTIATEAITARVRERYADAARRVQAGAGGCCGDTCCDDAGAFGSSMYDTTDLAALPQEAALASLGCGNPTALIDLRPGEVVLDLGSGGGIDVLLSARRVGPTGLVFGLDMTDEMLALALANKTRSGLTNVAFLKGQMENIPLPSGSVDVVISNCVINLAADKGIVLRETFRVLKPGGRFAVADVVADGPLPAELRRDMEAWVGCVAGALEIDTYQALLTDAGFTDVDFEITRRYRLADTGLDPAQTPADWLAADGRLASAFVRATKPDAGMVSVESAAPVARERARPLAVVATGDACCGPDCCT
ncbi:MAG: arsenite methyltransferase [Chloroflexi bacterium]|nr:arsenite methyltransferase [Chloroflexota bacterium]